MKKTDFAMIILIAAVGVMIAYFIASNIPFLKVPEEGIKVQTIEEIRADVAEPDSRTFNTDAINPTVEVVVGGGAE